MALFSLNLQEILKKSFKAQNCFTFKNNIVFKLKKKNYIGCQVGLDVDDANY